MFPAMAVMTLGGGRHAAREAGVAPAAVSQQLQQAALFLLQQGFSTLG